MKLLKLSIRKTIFSRLLFYNIILILFATSIFQIVYYNYFRILYDREFKDLYIHNLKQIQNSIDESIIKKLTDISNIYFSDTYTNEDLIYPIYNDISNDPISVIRIKKRLDDIKNSVGVIDSIDILYKRNGMLFIDGFVKYMNDGTASSLNEPFWIKEFENSTNNSIWLPKREIKSPEKKNIITYVKGVPSLAVKADVQAVIAINVNEKTVQSYIGELKDNFMIVDENGNCVAQNYSGLLPSKDEKLYDYIFSGKSEGYFTTEVAGEKKIVTYVKSDYNHWTYISLMPPDVFYNKSNQVRNVLFLFGVLLLGIYLAISVVLTKRAHKPLANILKDVNNISENIEVGSKGENEYNLLSNTFNNLVHKVDNLTQKIESDKGVIQENLVRQLLNGKCNTENEQVFDEIKFKYPNIFCFTIRLYFDPEEAYDYKIKTCHEVIKGIEREELNKWIIKAIIDDDTSYITGIVNFESLEMTDEIQRFMINQIDSKIKLKYVIGIGNTCEILLEEIPISYKESKRCLAYAYIYLNDKVLTFDSLKISSLKRIGDQVKSFGKIEDYIRSGDEEKLLFTVNGIIDSFSTKEYRISYCRNTLFSVVSTIRRTLNEIGYNDIELFNTDIFEDYKKIDNIQSFKSWIGNIIHFALKSINEKKSNIDKEVEVRIKKIIEDNIYKDISLDLVADELGIRPDTLSKMFKTVTNLNFTDYVRNLKLQYAATLLEENKFTVQEIANKLGYNAIHYFIRIFKEKYGCTPKKYQMMHTFSDNEK